MLKPVVILITLFSLSNTALAEHLLCGFSQPSMYRSIEIHSESKKALLTMDYNGRVWEGQIIGIGEHNHLNKYHIEFPTTNPKFAGRVKSHLVLIDWGNGSHRIHQASLEKVSGEWRLSEVERETFVTCSEL